MAFQTTPGVEITGALTLGFFRVNARYSVRGRRAAVLPVSIRMSLMTDEEKR
jgi:hypothetical protein